MAYLEVTYLPARQYLSASEVDGRDWLCSYAVRWITLDGQPRDQVVLFGGRPRYVGPS